MLSAVASSATPLVYAPKNPNIAPMTNSQNAISASGESSYLQATLSTPPHVTSAEDNLLTSNVMTNLPEQYKAVLTAVTPSGGTVDFGDGSSANYSTVNGIRNITFFFLDGTSTSVSLPIN
jgi:hypothetical protein